MTILEEQLKNYRQFVAKVDELCNRIGDRFRNTIVCAPGCDSCCRHLTLFPVEAVTLAVELQSLPDDQRNALSRKVSGAEEGGGCPLLADGRCLLYAVRPLICRTHGFPILTRDGGSPHVDFCPLNFRGVTSLPGEAVINIDQLNTALTAINAVFLASSPLPEIDGDRRLTIAAALRLKLPSEAGPRE